MGLASVYPSHFLGVSVLLWFVFIMAPRVLAQARKIDSLVLFFHYQFIHAVAAAAEFALFDQFLPHRG